MVKIVCIGDSITFGQHLEDPFQAWPYLLTGFDIRPAGVPSDTTRLGLERFPADVQSQQADGVVIQFGHNDCNRWDTDRGLYRVSLGAFRANLNEMIVRCEAFEARPLICALTPSRRSERHAADVALYDSELREVARKQRIEVIDVRQAFRSGDRLIMEDGLHLSVAGHRVYAKIVQETLDRAFT